MKCLLSLHHYHLSVPHNRYVSMLQVFYKLQRVLSTNTFHFINHKMPYASTIQVICHSTYSTGDIHLIISKSRQNVGPRSKFSARRIWRNIYSKDFFPWIFLHIPPDLRSKVLPKFPWLKRFYSVYPRLHLATRPTLSQGLTVLRILSGVLARDIIAKTYDIKRESSFIRLQFVRVPFSVRHTKVSVFFCLVSLAFNKTKQKKRSFTFKPFRIYGWAFLNRIFSFTYDI